MKGFQGGVMKTKYLSNARLCVMFFLLLALVGCGGGGGGGGSTANNNVAPVANVGVAQNVVTGTLVTLNGSASSDANGDPLTYSWTLTSKPIGSTATLTGATTVRVPSCIAISIPTPSKLPAISSLNILDSTGGKNTV